LLCAVLNCRRYAERLPIGLESVIRTVPADTVKGFYNKWYRPNNMAVVAVGDFASSPEEVLGLIKNHFGGIPVVPLPSTDTEQDQGSAGGVKDTPTGGARENGSAGDGDETKGVPRAAAAGDGPSSRGSEPDAGGLPRPRGEGVRRGQALRGGGVAWGRY